MRRARRIVYFLVSVLRQLRASEIRVRYEREATNKQTYPQHPGSVRSLREPLRQTVGEDRTVSRRDDHRMVPLQDQLQGQHEESKRAARNRVSFHRAVIRDATKRVSQRALYLVLNLFQTCLRRYVSLNDNAWIVYLSNCTVDVKHYNNHTQEGCTIETSNRVNVLLR